MTNHVYPKIIADVHIGDKDEDDYDDYDDEDDDVYFESNDINNTTNSITWQNFGIEINFTHSDVKTWN